MPKNQRIICLTVLVLVLVVLGLSEPIMIGSKHQISLNPKNSFQESLQIHLTDDKLKQLLQINNGTKQKNWFVFFDIEPAGEVSWPNIYVNIYSQEIQNKGKLKHIRQCSKEGLQLETCYLSNEDFNYTEQTLLVRVGSDQEVKILLLSEFMLMRKLQLNSCNKVDSSSIKSNSKLFKINIKQIAVKLEEIRISLTPINKMYGGQGLNLYGSFGQYFPTANKYDFTSFYAWEMGVVAVLLQRRLVEVDWVYILADYPQNYMFDLDITLIEDYAKPIELKTAEFYDDIIFGVNNQRTFIFIIDHPQLNNYIRIKKYHGSIIIENTSIIQYKQIVGTRRYQNKITDYSNEFQLASEEFKIGKGIKKLQVKLKTKSFYNVAVYTIETYQNSKDYNWIMDGQTQLAELIYNQKSYFVSRAIRHQNQLSSLSEAFIRVTVLKGKVLQRVFICLVGEVEKCLSCIKDQKCEKNNNRDDLLMEIKDLKSVYDELQKRKQINLNLSKNNFINYSEGYKQQIIMIEILGDQQQTENVFTVEFMNVGIIDTLTQHESKTQKFQEEEFKIYRFTLANDTQVHALIFHVTKLYGFVTKFVTDIDPSTKSQQELKSILESQPMKYVREYEDSIQIETIQPLKTYYLVVYAKSRAMITIKVQLKKLMSHPTDQRNISYSIFLINTLTSYSLTFSPGQLIILDFNQIKTPLVYLKGQALLPLDVCINLHHTGEKDLIPLQPKCQFRHKLGKKYEINLQLQIVQRQIGLYNGNNETVLLSLSLENQQKCVGRMLGDRVFFSGALFSENETKQLCLKMRLFKKGTLIVSYKPKSPLLHRLLRLSYMIGQTQGPQLTRYETIIESQKVQIACNRNYEQCYISLIGKLNEEGNIDETLKALKEEEIVFEVQYIDEPIDLFDGVQFTYMGPLQAQRPIRFKYSIFSVNQPVRLTLQKQIGACTVLAKVANRKEHYFFPQQKDLQNSDEKGNEQSVVYRASNQIFYLYETMIISSQELKKHCVLLQIDQYKVCTLLMSVFPINKEKYINPESKFTIEVVQHISNLKQSQPVPGYLEPEMTNLYEIENSIENSTIIVYVSSHTDSNYLNCFKMEAKLITANQSDDYQKYYSKEGEHTLIINNAVKGQYSLKLNGVESSQKYCDYILQFSVVPPAKKGEKEAITGPIMTLKRSTPFRLQMDEKKTEYFMFYNHARLSNFKVLTLFQKVGDVLISVMPLATSEQQRNLITHIKDIESIFKPEWKDSNTVEIYDTDKAYCGQCLYVIKIECLKAMKGSIIVPQASQQIYMRQNDLVYDQLLQGQKSFYSVYAGFEFTIKMKLISGEILIKVKNKEDNKQVFNKNYTSTTKQIIQKVQIPKNTTYEYKFNWVVEIICLVDTHFTLSLPQIKKQAVAEKNKEIVLGVPTSVVIVPAVQQCVTGAMEQDPIFIFTQMETFIAAPKASELLKFQFWVKNCKTNTKTSIPNENLEIHKTPNSLLLKIKSNQKTKPLFNQSNTFYLCFDTTNPMSFDIIQTSHVNYLPSNADILVNKNINFTFMAGEENILEINECEGNSWISISSSFGSIHSLESQISQIRRPNSLIEFQHKGPIFLEVESDGMMLINWKDGDLKKGKNIGYEMYDSGSFRILPASNPNDNLQIQILPLKDFSLSIIPKQTLPLFNDLVYEIYVEKQEVDLNKAMNCHASKGIKKQLRVKYGEFKDKKIVQLETINQLKARFLDSQIVLVSVKAKLQMRNKKTGSIEKYRYFYPFQEIILFEKDLRSVGQQANQSGKITYLLIGMLATVILITLLIIFCGKRIRTYMDKLRRRKISQQNHFQLKSEVTQTDHDRHYKKAIDV